MGERSGFTFDEVIKAATVTVDVLDDLGYKCCLFGGMACVIYGMDYRTPNDVDVIVLSDQSDEDIKDEVIDSSNRFFLEASKRPGMTYRKLFFKGRHIHGRRGPRKEIKIDVLVPGVIHIPKIPTNRIVYHSDYPDIPLVPLMTLILLKLQGWYINSTMTERWQLWKRKKKAPQDERDLKELLELVYDRGMSRKEEWCPRYLRRLAMRWVEAFVEENPGYRMYWEDLGFEVDY